MFAFILKEDPELAEGLPEDQQRAFRQLLRARVLEARGPWWEPPRDNSDRSFGLLVLDGVIGRRFCLGPAVAMELLSPGDILRPWQPMPDFGLIPAELDWRVFRPARFAVLDPQITTLIARHAGLNFSFSGRLLRRAHRAAYLVAVAHLPRVEDRLLATLSHLAATYGKVTPRGVKIPFRLTHQELGDVIGAKRPTVTLAIKHLRQRNELYDDSEGGYVLAGNPNRWIQWLDAAPGPGPGPGRVNT